MPKDRRFKLVRVSFKSLWTMFRRTTFEGGYWVLKDAPNVPEDVAVAAVQHNFEFQCFDVVLHHPTFDDVPDFQMIPLLLERLAEFTYVEPPFGGDKADPPIVYKG